MKIAKPKYLKVQVQLQKRDKKVLHFIHRFRICTLSQIHKGFFNEAQKISCFRRVRMLESSGYLKSHNLRFGLEKIYRLSLKGCSAIGVYDQELSRKGENIRVYSSQIPHDLALVDIAIALQSLPFKFNYLSENEIRSKFKDSWEGYICDGALIIKEPLQYVLGIEFEYVIKSEKQYLEKFQALAFDKTNYNHYLYILEDIELRHGFIRQALKLKEITGYNLSERLLFVELKALRSNASLAPIYTAQGSSFTFNDFYQKLINAYYNTPYIKPKSDSLTA